MNNCKGTAALLLGMAVLAAGCGRNMSISEIEAKERASRLYQTAMEDLQAGRTDPAIRGFEHVLAQEPGNYSAHFQLATLLQDIKKDYISAIAHYRAYLMFRPASDKATVASDRMRMCDTLLGAEYLRKSGGRATEKLSDENAKLTDSVRKLKEQVKDLEKKLAQAQDEVEQLKDEKNRRLKTLRSIGTEAEKGTPRKGLVTKEDIAKFKAMEGEQQRRRLRPSDAELLDDDALPEDRPLLAEAKRLKAESERDEEDTPRTGKSVPAPTATSSTGTAGGGPLDSFWAKNTQQKTAGSRPETYVVQSGDTLFKIAKRFYGSANKWRDIREANKAVISSDGRVKVGQEIRLP